MVAKKNAKNNVDCSVSIWICLPVYLWPGINSTTESPMALKRFVNALMPTSVPHDDDHNWTAIQTWGSLGWWMEINGDTWSTYRTKRSAHKPQLDKVIRASPGDMKGSKCQKGIHLNHFKVTLPPYTSETTRLCHFHRRWRHRTCPCES